MNAMLSRRELLRGFGVGAAAVTLAACQPKVVEKIVKETVLVKEEVEKEVTTVVEKEVEKVVKETVVVPQDVSKIVFWHIFGSGPSRDIFDKFVVDFNTANPGYVVEPVFTDFWTYDQKFLAALAAGEPPDVIIGDMTRAGQRAEAQQVIALTEYMSKDSFTLDNFVPYGVKDVNYKGEVWGIPFGPDTRILYYNKTAFEEVGLDVDTPPTTWDELWEFAHKLDVREGDSWTRIGFCPLWGNVWFLPFIWGNGAVLVGEGPEFYFESPEVIETAKWYVSWMEYYGKENLDLFSSGFGTEANDPFMSGQVPMIVQTNDYVGQLLKYVPDMQWGTGLVPHNGTPASWGAGFDLEIPTGAVNPDGAWEFIKFLVSKETAIAWAKASGWFPARMDAAQDPALLEIPGWDTILESMKVTQSRTFVLEAPTWYGPLTTAFQEICDGVKTPEEALADAQALVEQEVENYLATH
jgi:multiple sugar transport system substrate-binding protein